LRVTPIAYTQLNLLDTGYLATDEWMPADWKTSDLDSLAEFAGRACYQSFDKPNPKTRENDDYLANILLQNHESVLEHASVTFYVTGVSRALTHELVRHRHLSFSQLSQRYVDESDAELVVPPALDNDEDRHWISAGYMGRDAYSVIVDVLTDRGVPRKKAREAARAVLPNCTETKIVVTGNLRAWRDVLKKRWHVAADAEIQQFAGVVLAHLRDIAPNSVQDIPAEPYGSQ
jgi:thymidylate synthase (FAD)